MNYLQFVKQLNSIRFLYLSFCECGSVLETLSPEIEQLAKENIPTLLYKLLQGSVQKGYQITQKKAGSIFFLFSNSYAGRKDHLQTFKQVSNLTSDNYIMTGGSDKNIIASPITILGFIWYIQMSKLKLTPAYKLAFCILLNRVYQDYKFVKTQIKKQKNTIRLLVTFFDCAPIDSMVVSYCNSQRIPTATLQHGLYVPYAFGIPNLAYRNSKSKFFLSYGKWTNQQAEKIRIPSKKMILAGCPKYLGQTQSPTTLSHKGIFGVVLEGLALGEKVNLSNITLIKIANEFAKEKNLSYILRLHPSDHLLSYKKYLDHHCCIRIEEAKHNISIAAFAQEVDFALSNPSTAIAELIYLGKPVYIMNQANHPFDLMEEFIFDDCKTLMKKIEQHEETNLSLLLENIKNSFFAPGNTEKRYQRFFNHFL